MSHFWKGWETTYDRHSLNVVDVMPLGDSEGHDYGIGCPCKPKVEHTQTRTGKAGRVVLHNAFDRREGKEK